MQKFNISTKKLKFENRVNDKKVNISLSMYFEYN